MLFDSTLRREILRSFGATLVVVMTIVLTMFLIRTLGQAALGRASAEDVLLLLAYASVGHLPTILALSLFVAVVTSVSRMYRDSEMAVWFSSGVGLTRFIRPILGAAWPVWLLVCTLALWVWPWVNARDVELQQRFEQRSDLSRVSPGKFVPSGDGQSIFFIERSSADGRKGKNVFMLSRSESLEVVTTASQGQVEFRGEDRLLVLQQGQRQAREAGGGIDLAAFEQAELVLNEHVQTSPDQALPRARHSWDLWQDPTPSARGELAWRLGLCLGSINLLFAALLVSATPARRASNWNLLLALLTFVVYYNLINLSQAWVSSGKMALQDALLRVHGSAFVGALLLLHKRQSGWTWTDHATRMMPGLRDRSPHSQGS